MPPRTLKRGGRASGPKRSAKMTAESTKLQLEVVEESAKEVPIEGEEKPVVEVDNKPVPL